MRFKLDENLGRSVFRMVEAAGHDVSSIHLQCMAGSPDSMVYDTCLRERRVLVTFDLDFANPMAFDPRPTAGVAVLRLPKGHGPRDIGAVVEILLSNLATHSIEGQLWIVRSGRVRVWSPRVDGAD